MSAFVYGATTKRRRELLAKRKATRNRLAALNEPALDAEDKPGAAKLRPLAEEADRQASEALADTALFGLIAALVPAETLALHAFFLGLFTESTQEGTKITEPRYLEFTFYGLLVFTAAMYVAGKLDRAEANWALEWIDVLRVAIAVLAFVVWSVLLGTSAATPIIGDNQEPLMIGAAVLGAILLLGAKATAPTEE